MFILFSHLLSIELEQRHEPPFVWLAVHCLQIEIERWLNLAFVLEARKSFACTEWRLVVSEVSPTVHPILGQLIRWSRHWQPGNPGSSGRPLVMNERTFSPIVPHELVLRGMLVRKTWLSISVGRMSSLCMQVTGGGRDCRGCICSTIVVLSLKVISHEEELNGQ